MEFILKQQHFFDTKELKIIANSVIIGILFIVILIFLNYKPAYEVDILNEKIGYIKNIKEFKNLVNEELSSQKENNIVDISIIEEPKYKFLLLKRNKNFNTQDIIEKIKKCDVNITYRYYEVALNGETRAKINTLEEAEKIVDDIKQEFNSEELNLDLQINEYYTHNLDSINVDTIEVATSNIESIANSIKEQYEALAIINGIKLANLPVQGRITSRYGESSSLRRSLHTGLDIACSKGTEIKSVAPGTVIFSEYSGSYGNLVKIDHGNGIETWYGHASKLCVKVGDKVEAGDKIALVGSTGNSTGPHLHFEIRIDGNTVNPQKYIY